MGADLRRDQRSDRGLQRPRRAAARQPRARRAPRAGRSPDCGGWPAARSGSAAARTGDGPPCAVHRALAQQASRREITLPDGQIFSVTTFPIGPASDGPSVVQVAKNVTEEIASARRLRQMSDELATTNGRLVADAGAAEGDPGAAGPGREALGDRPAGRRRRARVEQPADQRDRLRAAGRGGAASRPEHAAVAGSRRRTSAGSPKSPNAPRGSSATCWRSPAARAPRARRRTWSTCASG